MEYKVTGRDSRKTRFLLLIILSAASAAAQVPLLQITSPSNNTAVTAGQTFTITVSADPSVQSVDIFSDGSFPIPN